MKAVLAFAFAAVAITGGAAGAGSARQDRPVGPALDVIQIQPNFYMIAGAGGNIGVQLGPDGVVVVDTGNVESAGAVLAAIRALSPLPIRYIINTADDDHHVGGNEVLARAGESLSRAATSDRAAPTTRSSTTPGRLPSWGPTTWRCG